MSAEQLITEHLDIWTSAHKTRSSAGRGSSSKLDLYGIKKLRELILELAVRGKLVPQDPNDEPASELLKKIAAEKASLIYEGKIKNEKSLPPIKDSERPFILPEGWSFARLSELALSQAGFAFKSNCFNEKAIGLPLIRIRDVGQEFSGTYYDGEFREEFIVNNGDYLISMDGNFRVAEWQNGTALLNQRVSRLIFFGKMVQQKFIAESLQARLLSLQGVKAYTTVDHLSGGQISNAVIGLPPLTEQHRIVAKVDELMAFCDELEQAQTDNIAAHAQLVEALLTTLTNSKDHQELQANWQRIAEHFDTLFTTEDSIDQLKQTILQLAVIGKLVQQNPNDEPASELLKKIAAEKTQLIKEGKIKKEKPLLEISDEEKPFELPDGWEWTRLGHITDIKGGKRVSNGYKLLKTPTPFIYIRVSDFKDGTIDDTDLHYIDEKMREQISRYIITKDDLYITIVGATIGKCGLVPPKFDNMNLTENAARLVLSKFIDKLFTLNCLTSSFCQSQFIDKTMQVGVQKMALNRLSSSLIPLPPLNEQHRIVAKVYELMTICDLMKISLQSAQDTQLKLVDTLVEQVVF